MDNKFALQKNEFGVPVGPVVFKPWRPPNTPEESKALTPEVHSEKESKMATPAIEVQVNTVATTSAYDRAQEVEKKRLPEQVTKQAAPQPSTTVSISFEARQKLANEQAEVKQDKE